MDNDVMTVPEYDKFNTDAPYRKRALALVNAWFN
jgi:hypothetical protein